MADEGATVSFVKATKRVAKSRRREGRQAELWLMKEPFLLNEIIPEGRHQQPAQHISSSRVLLRKTVMRYSNNASLQG
jgi:hypothetical protein